ncbi:MAG: trehalose-phosphatase [Candidatus Omnitrophota bacterium]
MPKYTFEAVVFDLDGVITKTALVHAAAWKATFDEYMCLREKRDFESFREFTHESDYLPYVDGKPRYDGVKSFLESRGINIPFGESSDPPDKETICGLGNKKNAIFNDILRKQGAEVYPSSIKLIKELKKTGIHTGVASSSKNCKGILESVGIADLIETRVDGVVSVKLGLKGKPEGDIFVTAARNMGAEPANSVVVEDATSGVQAGRNGGFGLVLGVARGNNESELLENGADIVVTDLSEITIDLIEKWFHKKPRPLFDSWDKIEKKSDILKTKKKVLINPYYFRNGKEALLDGKRLVFFLDYDGSLTPIVDKSELAVLSNEMRDVIKELAEKHTVAIVSGRLRDDVEKLVGIKGLFYAGSHGFDIAGPGFSMVHPVAKEAIPIVLEVIKKLKKELGNINGLLVEEKKFSVAVHYRLVDEDKYLSKIKEAVERNIQSHKQLRLMQGKKVFEILPNIDWNKGMAIRWIMQALKISWEEASVVYIGDDTTDEFAFRVVRTRGTAILVSDEIQESTADFKLSSSDEVKRLFRDVVKFS